MSLKILFNILFLFGLTSCTSFKEKIGLTHYSPNEFETLQHDPLEMPPSLQLDNPDEGPYKTKTTATDKARALLITSSARLATSRDHKAEEVLLTQIKADHRELNIRRTLDRENAADPSLQEKIQNTLVFWKKSQKGQVIDAEAEQKKIESEETAEEK